MSKKTAIENAQCSATKYQEAYVAIKTRNGQWMRERLEFFKPPYYKGTEEHVICNP